MSYLNLMSTTAKPKKSKDEPRGMLDLTHHGSGIVRCCGADCGWEGHPTYIDGVALTTCPSCEKESDEDILALAEPDPPPAPAPIATIIKGNSVGRNDPCLCGSGKKSKKCCNA